MESLPDGGMPGFEEEHDLALHTPFAKLSSMYEAARAWRGRKV